jgi:hypothetical protein
MTIVMLLGETGAFFQGFDALACGFAIPCHFQHLMIVYGRPSICPRLGEAGRQGQLRPQRLSPSLPPGTDGLSDFCTKTGARKGVSSNLLLCCNAGLRSFANPTASPVLPLVGFGELPDPGRPVMKLITRQMAVAGRATSWPGRKSLRHGAETSGTQYLQNPTKTEEQRCAQMPVR